MNYIVTLLNLVSLSYGARILAYVPTPSFSHQVIFQPLWRELSKRGHQVMLITPSPMNDPSLTNLTEIDLHSTYTIVHSDVIEVINSGRNTFKALMHFVKLYFRFLDTQMEHESVKQLIANTTLKFDIVLVEHLLVPAIGFAKKFGSPLIGISSLPLFEFLHPVIGVPIHPILFPDPLLPFDKAETFLERVTSVAYMIFNYILFKTYIIPNRNEAIEKHFGKGFGTVDEITRNVSMFLVNTNVHFETPRPLMPGIIHIGGIHRILPKPLPTSLRTVLDSADEGFIYFSLGSNVKSKDLSIETTQTLLDAFSELPYKVLWKYETDNLPNKPDNVIISKWFPQTDVLRHPNIKLFITQGGLQSLEEAIYDGVPMIGIPYFADQFRNVQKMVRSGYCVFLDLTTIEKEYFKKVVLEVIHNPKYRENAKKARQLFEDHQIPPLEQAVWWVEYAIRHKGAPHFRSPLLDIPLYQYLLLDVLGLLFLTLIVLVYLTYTLVRILLNTFKTSLKRPEKQKQQ